MGEITYPIVPCPKPRQTAGDRWKKRPRVMRYRAFADECRLRGVVLPSEGASVTFALPMPKSWSKREREAMEGQPHQQKPDLDNLVKALADAVHSDDSHIWHYRELKKVWGITGSITIAN